MKLLQHKYSNRSFKLLAKCSLSIHEMETFSKIKLLKKKRIMHHQKCIVKNISSMELIFHSGTIDVKLYLTSMVIYVFDVNKWTPPSRNMISTSKKVKMGPKQGKRQKIPFPESPEMDLAHFQVQTHKFDSLLNLLSSTHASLLLEYIPKNRKQAIKSKRY